MRSLDVLLQFLSALPRIKLGHFPTPLVRLERLSERLGVELWMKRDDCSGVAMGGNKTRKLEFILADARARGATSLVTVGPITSNHLMMTATAARRAGFDMHCVIGAHPPAAGSPAWSGNLLLLDYLGASLYFCPMNFEKPDPEDGRRIDELCAQVTAETGGYFIPGGGTMPQAEPGYMSCVGEVARQRGSRFEFDDVVLPFGTGSTTTGVLLGMALGGFTARVHPIAIETRYAVEDVFRLKPPAQLFEESVAHFRLPLSAADLPAAPIVYGFADEGYGVPSAGSDRAIRLMASVEGYFLDPVYTAKAFHGLVEMVADGRIPKGARVLFIHTGGLSMTPAADKRWQAQGLG